MLIYKNPFKIDIMILFSVSSLILIQLLKYFTNLKVFRRNK